LTNPEKRVRNVLPDFLEGLNHAYEREFLFYSKSREVVVEIYATHMKKPRREKVSND